MLSTASLARLAIALLALLSSSGAAQEPSREAMRHFEQARAAEARGEWSAAELQYRQAIKLAPSWAEAFVNLGIVYNRLGNAEEAVRAFARAAQLNPELLGAHLNLAITYFRANRFSEAETPLRRALEIDPANDQAARLLVLAVFAQEHYTEAAALVEKLLARSPDDAGLLEIAGRAYLKLRRYAQAARALENRTRLIPERADVYLLLGEALDNLHDTEGAIREFKRAIAASGARPIADAHFALGYAYWKLRRYDEAEAAFKGELARDPRHAPSVYYLGNIALARGDLSRAIGLLEEAAKAIPQDFAVRYDLGKALLQAGESARALEQLKMAASLNPKSAGVHYQLGLALRRLKRDDEAEREFARSRELNAAEREQLEEKVQGEERKKKPPRR